MDKIRCIIVEDELPAADELKYLLSQYDFLEVIATAQDGENAKNIINDTRPEVVFMDINIPLGSGIDIAKQVKEKNKSINIIFITAYEQHAIKAFEIEAMDYLLKPYDEKRLEVTVQRLKKKFKKKGEGKGDLSSKIDEVLSRLHKEEKLLKKVPCEYNGKITLVEVEEVHFAFIEEEKTYIKTEDKKYFTNYTLQELEGRTRFFRAHRSFLVNLDNASELYSWFHGTYKLIMNDKERTEIPISRSKVKQLKELLGL